MKRLSDHIRVHDQRGATVQILPWQIDSVVSIRGSYAAPVQLESGEGLQLDLLAAMLDKGTRSRPKGRIYDQLERMGASVSFSSNGDRVDFQARCLARDLDATLELVREQVAEPALPAEELDLVKGRTAAHLMRQASDPAYMSRNRLSRVLFPEGHPARELPLQDLTDQIAGSSEEQLQTLHARSGMFDGLRVAIVGDVGGLDPTDVASRLDIRPDGSGQGFTSGKLPPVSSDGAQHHHIEIPDRPNLNVMLGQPVDITTTDADYLALWTAVFILGGNFSSRLMSTVRDELGLTYGIRSYLSGMAASRGGAWVTGVTLSSDKLEQGIQATRAVIEEFVSGGIAASELDERKQTMIGSYEVELATTAGAAGRLLLHMNRGWEIERIDSHPERVRAIQTDEVNGVVGRMLHAASLSLVTAGTQA